MKLLRDLLGLLAAAVVVVAFLRVHGERPAERPQPIIVPVPHEPHEPDGRKPHRPRPRLLEEPAPDGTEPAVDYPSALWFKNVGSKKDGAGMCVFTSAEFCFLWAGLDRFRGFRDWCAERYPGGGYPEKLAKLVTAYCHAKQIPPGYFDPQRDLIQYEGSDPSWIEACLKNGWLPGVTLYHSPRYGGGTIYHMTCCPALTDRLGCTLDNNFQPYEWAPREEWLRRIKLNGKYWAFAVVAPGPPPCPTN